MVVDEICSWAIFSFNIFLHSTTKIMCYRLEWFTIQHLISTTTSNVDFKVFERSNAYSNVFIKKTRGDLIHSVLIFTVQASWAVVKKKQAL